MSTVGRVWTFGDDIDTDVLAPGAYMKGTIENLAAHCLEAVDPVFASSVRPGDVVIGGKNFGMGSSREQAAQALKILGVQAVFARTFAGIFYRNAINLGLPVFTAEGLDQINSGDTVSLDIRRATLTVQDRGIHVVGEPLPDFLLAMIESGGLVPHLEKTLKATGRQTT